MDQSSNELPRRHAVVEGQRVTATHALLYLRLFELAVVVMVIHWIMWTGAPGVYRNIRLALATAFLAINVTGIGICVLWLKVTPW